VEANALRGLACTGLGRWKEAVEHHEHFLEEAPADHPGASQVEGNLAEARAHLDR
jgi:cytochrome c-type biogenesis protein CcmH/NrfG